MPRRRNLADAVAEGLQGEGYEVTLSPDGEDALSSIRRLHFDLVLLDVMLPTRSGLEVLGDMRRTGLNAPVLILTSGAHRVDTARTAPLFGVQRLERATPELVRTATAMYGRKCHWAERYMIGGAGSG